MQVFKWLDIIAAGISFIGITIIFWGIVACFIAFVLSEWQHLGKSQHEIIKRENVRLKLGTYLLLGLEFLIAADIIHSAHNPELESLYVLGLTVLIRTVISFFLNREFGNRNILSESPGK